MTGRFPGRWSRYRRAVAAALVALATLTAGPGRSAGPVRPPDEVLRAAQSADGNIRRKAAEDLGSYPCPLAVERLGRMYRSEDEDAYGVKAACADALGRTARPEAAAHLAGMLRDPDYWVRKRAARALGTIPGPEATDALEGAARDPDPRVRAAAVRALGRRGEDTPAVRAALDDPDDRVMAEGLSALVAVGAADARGILSAALARDSWRVRLRAAALLAREGDPAAIRVLADAIRSGAHGHAAVRELASCGPDAFPALAALFRDPTVPGPERERILDAVATLPGDAPTDLLVDAALEPALPAALRVRAASAVYDRSSDLTGSQVTRTADLLADPDPNLVGVALQVLLERGGPPLLDRVAPLASHPNPVIRHFALRNLARYGGPEHEPAFIRALTDPKGVNIRLALETLERIGTEKALPALAPLAEQRKFRRYATAAMEAIEARR